MAMANTLVTIANFLWGFSEESISDGKFLYGNCFPGELSPARELFRTGGTYLDSSSHTYIYKLIIFSNINY